MKNTVKLQFRNDGALEPEAAKQIIQFDTQKHAKMGAKELPGYQPSDVLQVRLILGINVWTISDHHMNAVTREAWAAHIKETIHTPPLDDSNQTSNS